MTTTVYSAFDRLRGLCSAPSRKLQRAWHDRSEHHDLLGRVAAINSVQAVIEFTPDGTILDANDNFLRSFGYERGQVIGRHHRMFVDPDERESEDYREFWQQLGKGQNRSGLFRRIDAQGNEVWIQGIYKPLRNQLGHVHRVVKYATDVTEQRLAAADMQSRLTAIDRAQAVVTFDLDGIVQEANDNFLTTMGYRRDEVIGKHHRIFVDKQERESAGYRELWKRLHNGEYNVGLFNRSHRNGSTVWLQASYNPILDASGHPRKVLKLATDVTRQTLAAQTLCCSMKELNATVPAIAGEVQTASKLAAEATASANAGNALVEMLVADIGDINQHSRDMNEIISVMNSIAFQTNILSLNAAVEAAHAGELGKGFAVVAQEVRALAQRSAESAKDIQALVQSTIDSVASCSKHAERAGHAMQAITGSSTQVGQLIRQIAEDARTQANGLSQASRTLAELQAGTSG